MQLLFPIATRDEGDTNVNISNEVQEAQFQFLVSSIVSLLTTIPTILRI